jgi:hypothetical protein
MSGAAPGREQRSKGSTGPREERLWPPREPAPCRLLCCLNGTPGRASCLQDLRQERQRDVAGRDAHARRALRYFAPNGTDHRSHAEQNAAIAAYVRWRNTRGQPKVNFTAGSTIRT